MIPLICTVVGPVLLVLAFKWGNPNGPDFNKGLYVVGAYALMLVFLVQYYTPGGWGTAAFMAGVAPLIGVLILEEQTRKRRERRQSLRLQLTGPMPTHEQITEP
jgi:hypothetical protein